MRYSKWLPILIVFLGGLLLGIPQAEAIKDCECGTTGGGGYVNMMYQQGKSTCWFIGDDCNFTLIGPQSDMCMQLGKGCESEYRYAWWTGDDCRPVVGCYTTLQFRVTDEDCNQTGWVDCGPEVP